MLGNPKQKIIVLAEAPIQPTLKIEDYLYDDKDSKKLPKELGVIYDKYKKKFQEYQSLDDLRTTAIQKVVGEYAKANPNVPYTSLSNADFDAMIVQPTISMIGNETDTKIKALIKELASLYGEFENHKLNPKEVSNTFISEGNNLKTFYKDNKDISVDVIPIYKGQTDEKVIKGKLKNTSSTDKVVFLGHHGEKLGGYTHKELTDIINQSPASECHMGSCDFENYVNNFQDLRGKTLYYRPDSKYLGIDPTASNFMDAMYGRMYDNGIPTKTKAVEGTNYKVQKFKRGGVVKAGGEPKPIRKSELEKDLLMRLLTLKNSNLNWVDRGLNPQLYPSINNNDGTYSTHRLSSAGVDNTNIVFPTIIQRGNGVLEELNPEDALRYALETNTGMSIPSAYLADLYALNGLIDHENGDMPRKLIK